MIASFPLLLNSGIQSITFASSGSFPYSYSLIAADVVETTLVKLAMS